MITKAWIAVKDRGCVEGCPVDAIFRSYEVPAGVRDHIETNRFIFAETSAT